MKTMINALVSHLNSASIASTVEAYQGQLKDTVKLTRSVPGIYITLSKAMPFHQTPNYAVDLICVSKNAAYNKQDQSNLDLVDSIGIWLKENFAFSDYYLDAHNMDVGVVMIHAKYSIYRIRVNVFEN